MSSSSGSPMKLPMTRETTGWATSLTRSHSPRGATRSRTPSAIARIASSCCGDALGGEAAIEELLDPVVLRRVHADEHPLLELERDHVRQAGDAAALGGEGLPVEADLADVLGLGQGPEPGLAGVLVDLAPVDRAAAAQLGEDLVGRAVLPVLAVGDVERDQLGVAQLLGPGGGGGGFLGHHLGTITGWPASVTPNFAGAQRGGSSHAPRPPWRRRGSRCACRAGGAPSRSGGSRSP